jgi:hypothetical protein
LVTQAAMAAADSEAAWAGEVFLPVVLADFPAVAADSEVVVRRVDGKLCRERNCTLGQAVEQPCTKRIK